MKNLIQHLRTLHSEPFDCIVHVGAGGDALEEDYATLKPAKLLLIEADPDAANRLAQRFEGHPAITVLPHLVQAHEGDTVFHRFSLPIFNGPLGLGRLRELYPRIVLRDSISVRARALASILGGHNFQFSQKNLLILDIPGQEHHVLASLPSGFLEAFPFAILLGSSESWQEGAQALNAALELLRNSYFELVERNEADPAWPIALLSRDSVKVGMGKELENRAQLLVEKATEIHQQSERLKDLESQNATLRSERDALSSDLSAKTTLLDVLTKGRVAQDEQMEKMLQENASLAKERDGLLGKIQDLEAQLAKAQEHAKLIDEEFGKAEGQLELIKDIFLRESLR